MGFCANYKVLTCWVHETIVSYRVHSSEGDGWDVDGDDTDVLDIMTSRFWTNPSRIPTTYSQYFGTRFTIPSGPFSTINKKFLYHKQERVNIATFFKEAALSCTSNPQVINHRVQHTARWNSFLLRHMPGELPAPRNSRLIRSAVATVNHNHHRLIEVR